MKYPNYQVKNFSLNSPYEPAGDQAKVIQEISSSLKNKNKEQTILGVTGSGKTYMMAKIIQNLQKPTLIIAHNKTLAAQLAEEFANFFPDNAVSYFVSYYDYYQPESYIASSDTYIEKQTQINEEIEMLRNLATSNLLTRSDVIIVASVSAIYGLGDPESFMDLSLDFVVGQSYNFAKISRDLINMQFARSQNSLTRGQFRIQGDLIEVVPAGSKNGIRFSFFGDELEAVQEFDIITQRVLKNLDNFSLFPANPYATTAQKIDQALPKIKKEAEERSNWFQNQGRFVESQRIKEKVERDLEMLSQFGFVSGIENYSPILEDRLGGFPPATLLDFFPEDYITFIDESHITLPQIGSMYVGDRSRKENLINYGFRLPSAVHNRPLKLPEFFDRSNQLVYVSATPSNFELGFGEIPKDEDYKSQNQAEFKILKDRLKNLLLKNVGLEEIYQTDIKLEELVKLSNSVYRLEKILNNKNSPNFETEISSYLDGLEMGLLLEKSLFGKKKKIKGIQKFSQNRSVLVSKAIIRPTGLIDPEIILMPVEGQVDDILERIKESKKQNHRVLITTLTKKFAEELDLYFKEIGVRSTYMHFGVGAMERQDIIRDLRNGTFDVLIGINLLREGLDLPEVGLVAIFDADKEGFLRSKTSLIQTIGRAARNSEGKVIMYADRITDSMKSAIQETEERRNLQIAYNKKNNITPKSTSRGIQTISDQVKQKKLEKDFSETKNDDFEDEIPVQSNFANKSGRKNLVATDQAYKAFAESKKIWLEKLENSNFSKKELQEMMQEAVEEMDFEKASAIKDLLGF